MGPRGKQVAPIRQKRDYRLLVRAAPSTARVFGYARVSTEDQSLDMQTAALRNAGVAPDNMFVEKVSAVVAKRPQYNLLMKGLEAGDTIVVYALSRLSRNLKQLLTLVDDLQAMGVTIRSTSEAHIDPTTSQGRLLISITGAVDENERNRVRDRTRDGMKERQRQGQWIGRRALFDDKQRAQIKRDRQNMTAKAAAKKWKCSAGTIDKYAKA